MTENKLIPSGVHAQTEGCLRASQVDLPHQSDVGVEFIQVGVDVHPDCITRLVIRHVVSALVEDGVRLRLGDRSAAASS